MSMSKQDLFGRLTAVEDLDDIRVELKAMIAQIEAEAPEPETSFDELAEGFALGTLSALIDAVLPEASTEDETAQGWKVVLFNDDQHGFGEVAQTLHTELGISVDEAASRTLQAHNEGETVFLFSSNESAFAAHTALHKLGLKVGIMPLEG